ncbi:MAG: GntR family transcriptional regulator [Steroidobacteraceae bacterium]|nr:GntR family transcriptional regulator [Nevskiaceae bacterium]MCP5360716.1 GntR family transcriptional regulator [Nevskiaceae bacterium]MCP5466189.1 GntR family transcriptional regulator [Nevskiaceae bacterium]
MSSRTNARRGGRGRAAASMPRSRHKLVALHHQIYLTLRNELIRGHYRGANGDAPLPLPAENELAAQFAVSRVTVRRALAALEQEGLIVRRHGAGTFATPMSSYLRRVRDAESLYDELSDLIAGYQQEVLAYRRMETPEFIHNHAGDFGTECVYLNSVSKRDDLPVHLNHHYVPAHLLASVDRRSRPPASFLMLLQERGIQARTFELNISCTAADLETATQLDVQSGIPLLAARRIARDAQGGIVEYFEVLTRPDLFSYGFRFNAKPR